MTAVKNIWFWVCWLTIANVNGQKNTTASGGVATGSGGTVSYSVGQIDYTSSIDSNSIVNRGVQQPYEIFKVGIDKLEEICLQVFSYPNPAQNYIYLRIDLEKIDSFKYELTDLNGKTVFKKAIYESITRIPMQEIGSGIYFITIYKSGTKLKSIKIVKNN